MTSDFTYPKIHSFPPLYTKQPNSTILQNQLDAWCVIILSYCEHYKVSSLSLNGLPIHSQVKSINLNELPSIFENKLINRVVNDEFKLIIFKHLIHKLNKGDYINDKEPELGILVYWRPLHDWANLLYNYIESTGQLGTVLTIYELTKSDENELPELIKNLDYNLLIRILKEVLIKQGKAQILMNEDNEIGGVKIV